MFCFFTYKLNIYRHPTVSAKTLCFQAVRPPRLSVRSDRSCYDDISWTA